MDGGEAEPVYWSGQSLPPPPEETARRRTRHFWTTREIRVLKETYPARGIAACAEALPGRTPSAIYKKAYDLGLLRSKGEARAGRPRGRQPYPITPEIDEAIRRAYADPTRGSVNRCAQLCARPRWWVVKRAYALGVVVPRFNGPAWTEPEDAIVTDNAHRPAKAIARRLKAAGYTRTAGACASRLRHLGAQTGAGADPHHYTARGLAQLMGIDDGAVARWISEGLLKARRRGTERTAEQGGDQWWIHRRDVRVFVAQNPVKVDLRKVDKYWFIDLLTEGRRRG